MSDMKFSEGIHLFNQEEFYECHEVLESLWLKDHSSDRLFYQGLIQVASGFFHVQKGRTKPALQVLRSGLEKLSPYPQSHHGINLGKLIMEVENWLTTPTKQLPKIEHARIF